MDRKYIGAQELVEDSVKPRNNETAPTRDFFIHETDNWLVFAHEVEGMSVDEICEHKPGWRDTILELDAFFEG